MDIHNQPTVPDLDDDTEKRRAVKAAQPPAHSSLPNSAATGNGNGGTSLPNLPAMGNAGKRQGQFSRRKMLGVTALAGAGVAAGGGTALAVMWQNGTLRGLFGGPVAGSVQIGHLLRRAGFGARPEEVATYAALGFQGAVE